MKLPLALVALLSTAGLSRADVVIVQSVEGMAQTGQMTIMVGADKVRTDVTPQLSTITDTATGDVTTLMHAQQAFMIIPAAASKAMMAQMMQTMQQTGGATASPPPPVATGKKDKVNGYDAEEYTFSNGNMKATYWIATDFPDAKMVEDALAKFRKGGLADITRGLAPDMSLFPGVPVKTEVQINGQKITTALISAKEQPVDPTEYEVPAAYSQLKLPGAPQP